MSGEPDAVRYEREGAAAVVTIDRQHRRNAVDGFTAATLDEAYRRFEAEEGARVLVLTGDGGILLRRRRPEGDRTGAGS